MFPVKDRKPQQNAFASIHKNRDRRTAHMQSAEPSLDSLYFLQRHLGNSYLQAVHQLKKASPGDEVDFTEQQAERENKTGLPDQLKAGIENLSGLAMDDVRVHYNSSKPAELQALAYTQGTEIHLGPGQERHLPHEAWHVVQQRQGRVRAMMQANGVTINDDQRLEKEADVMGSCVGRVVSIQRRKSGKATAILQFSGNMESPATNIQRKVNEFTAKTENYYPPGTDLIDTVDTSKFQESPKEIKKRIREMLNDPLVKMLKVPTEVSAILEKDPNDKVPTRSGTRSANIGQIGRDEFFIRTGQQETFEGGHLIPHALWDESDKDVEEADGYCNLVPMSRQMNVVDWADREKRYKEKLQSLQVGEELKATITIRHEAYKLRLGDLAARFELHLALGTDPEEKTGLLYNWLPRVAEPRWENLQTSSDAEMTEVEERPLRRVHSKIRTSAELLSELEKTVIWSRLSQTLRAKLKAL